MAEGEERPSGVGDDENGKYPTGFRFKPTTEELVEFYLLPKLLGEPTVPNEFVIEADAYGCDPEILTEKYKESGVDDTWYFLSPRYRKYRGGDRPVRRTADDRGRWKPSTGQSKPPEEEEDASTSRHSKAKKAAAFSENTLAYYVGPTKDEAKTKWLMHELVVPETADNGGFHSRSATAAGPRDDMLLNRYVACRIYKSPLRKWKEIEIEEAEAAAEVPTSSQSSSGPAAREGVGEAAARAPSSSKQPPPAKRPAVERAATSGHTSAPNKGVSSQTTLFPGGRSAPTRGSGGGSSVRMPAGAGAGAAGHHGPAGLPALVHWPPPVYNSMQGPVQLQRPPLVYGYGKRAAGTQNANGQAAPGQGPPVSRLHPPQRASATAPNSLGLTTMICPPNLAAGQSAGLLSPQQQQQPPPETETETEKACRNRVYARLIAEMKLQKAQEGSAARAGQQQISQTASAKPACFHDEGGDRPAGVEAMVPPAQFPAPHSAHPYGSSSSSSSSNLAQRPQRQQSGPAAPVEKVPAAENVPTKQSVPPSSCANERSGKGNAADHIILQILTANLPL